MQSGIVPFASVWLIRTEIRLGGNTEHTAAGKVSDVAEVDLNTGE